MPMPLAEILVERRSSWDVLARRERVPVASTEAEDGKRAADESSKSSGSSSSSTSWGCPELDGLGYWTSGW